ncbi:MAG: serine/threonine protein kinase, partial [Tannerellaceae bacterium]|nr:serine/threonine protein kinase [Tannerellaceae bacterium]
MKNDDATTHHQALTQATYGATVGDNAVPAADTPIEKGNTLLDLYKVESDPIVGGMGRVFRIRHTGWNTDLAMKQPKRELFQNEAQKQAFIHECDAWINLGLHPHIVSCYYVREIGGIPSIFSEWMDGGSLKGYINSGALYEGSEETVLERILDISIQFARGLHYAHEQQLIHQDVKPDNLLLTKTGEAKVADFGLANAKTMLGAEAGNTPSGTGTIISKSGGYTPAYCSPEQQTEKGELTRRTDIWSWAVSVLEMFVGERPWNNGVVAGLACEDYFDMERTPLPETMKALLRHCFKQDEAERPHDFKEIETALLQIYHDSTAKA